MCGIVVGLAFGKLSQPEEAMRQKLLRYFTTELMIATEDRGKDATGAVVLFDDGKYMGLKRGEKVTEFLSTFGETKEYYGSLLKVWRDHNKRGRVFLGHCRAGTSGDKEDNENNHPIKIGNLVGIHNGVIRNHDVIFEKLGCKRDGKVDSEAIFRLFDYYTRSGKEPFTFDMIQEVINKLDGQFAITLFNADNLEQIPIFRDGRPVELVLLRPYGILLMVSEKKFWDRIHFRYERVVHYYNEMHRIKLPSLLGDGDILTKALADDHAAIFDMSKKVTEDTEIADLCEIKKMDRNSKVWKSTTSTSYNNYGTNYRNSNYSAVDKSKGAEADDKRRRVFDKITKQYRVKSGDETLSAASSTTIPVDKEEPAKGEEGETKVNITPVKPITATVSDQNTNTDEKGNGPDKDNAAEETYGKKVILEDHTTYDADKNELENNSDVTDVDPKDIKALTDIKAIELTGSVTEVDMITYPPEVVESANKAYKDLPIKQKGCASLDELLDAIDIKDKDTAYNLGIELIGSRSIKHGWLQGFMHAIHLLSTPADDKDRKREHHITALKSLIILMAQFYKKSKGTNEALNAVVKKRLSRIILNNNKPVNIIELTSIFNSHDRQLLEEMSGVIAQASDDVKTKNQSND